MADVIRMNMAGSYQDEYGGNMAGYQDEYGGLLG